MILKNTWKLLGRIGIRHFESIGLSKLPKKLEGKQSISIYEAKEYKSIITTHSRPLHKSRKHRKMGRCYIKF